MKRFYALMLAVLILFTCAACKKETPPAPESGGGQLAAGKTTQIVSGVSVRVPAVQYRLARTELEGLTTGSALLPYSGGAVLTGGILTQSETGEPVLSDAAAYYTLERACTVQSLPVSPDGFTAQAALEGDRLYYIELCERPDGTQWLLHADGQAYALDEALSGVSFLTAMAVQNGEVLLAADGACVISCAMDGTLLWKQPAAEIKRFFRTQDGEQADQQLLMDLLYGDCPDLLFVNGLPFAQYARQRLLEDLYTWIDADETLSRTDFTQNLLHALETDGALYRLPQTYLLATAAGLPDIVGGREAWSMMDFLDTAQAHPEIGSVFAQDDGASMIQLLLLYAPNAFVDYKTAQARFDSTDFLRLLELAKRQIQPEAESPREALLTEQTLLEQMHFSHTKEFEEAYADGLNELSFPGFPGAGRASFYPTLPMAIPVNAREKEGAWALLKLLITEPIYAARSRGGWLPLQTNFEKKTDAMADPAAQQLLRALQAEAVSVLDYDAAIQSILTDELPYYFAGEQTAEQIAERIQRRVQLYLEETYR